MLTHLKTSLKVGGVFTLVLVDRLYRPKGLSLNQIKKGLSLFFYLEPIVTSVKYLLVGYTIRLKTFSLILNPRFEHLVHFFCLLENLMFRK